MQHGSVPIRTPEMSSLFARVRRGESRLYLTLCRIALLKIWSHFAQIVRRIQPISIIGYVLQIFELA